MKIFKLCIFDRTFSLESQVTLCASGTHTKLSTKHWSNMSCFFIPSLHNLMVVDPSLLKSSENIGRDGQNQLFQNSWNLPKASNNLRSIYLRKTAESHWAGFVALQLELLPSLFAQVCSNLENQQACSHWMGRACWGASKKKKRPFRKHCPYLTCCPAPWKSPVSLLSLDLTGAQNLICRKTLSSGPLSKTISGNWYSAAEGSVAVVEIRTWPKT